MLAEEEELTFLRAWRAYPIPRRPSANLAGPARLINCRPLLVPSAAMFRLSAARLFIDLVTAWQPDLQAACKNCDGRKAIDASCQFSLRPCRPSFGYGKRQYSCDSLTQLSEIALALQIKLIKRPAPLRFLERVPLFPHTESQLDLRDCLKWKSLQLPNAFRPSQIQIRAQEVEHQVHCRTWCWPTCARGPWRRSFEKFGQRGI
jgi:hypothetical protein